MHRTSHWQNLSGSKVPHLSWHETGFGVDVGVGVTVGVCVGVGVGVLVGVGVDVGVGVGVASAHTVL